MRAREVGFIPQAGEILLCSCPAVLRFWYWSHLSCTVSLSNQRLMLWDREDDRHSYSWAPHELPRLQLALHYDTDLRVTPPGARKSLQIGMEPAHRNTLLRHLAQHFHLRVGPKAPKA